MKVLAAINMHGAGTAQVESLLSVLHRLAMTYQVTFKTVCSLTFGVAGLSEWFDRSAPLSAFQGWSPTTQKLVDSLECLTGSSEVRQYTLLKLAPVFATSGGHLLHPQARWCPACLDPETGVQYTMLAHSLARVRSCPLHRQPLAEACAACGQMRSWRLDGPTARTCRRCGARLWRQPRPCVPCSPYDVWVENQLFDLLAYTSDADRPAPGPNWSTELGAGFARIDTAARLRYSRAERETIYILQKSAAKSRQPIPNSLLRFAAIRCVDLVDVLMQPEAVCAPRLENIQPVRGAVRTRHRIPAKRWEEVQSEMKTLLKSPDDVRLPSTLSLCAQFGVPSAGYYFQFHELATAYAAERRRRDQAAVARRNAAALHAARSQLSKLQATCEPVLVKSLIKHVRQTLNVSRNVALRAVVRARSELALEPKVCDSI